jgi:hypothetical protein
MSGIKSLPQRVVSFIEEQVVAEFATVSSAGLPIDTPTYYFPSDDLSTIDLATGLGQPMKAERARKNPKVGLMFDGADDEPVVVMRAHAAVRDKDLQSNAIRYIAETGFKGISHGITWEQARLAVNYWTRVIIENTPSRIYWWDKLSDMDRPPQVWEAPAGTVYPESDPAWPGETSRSPWPPRPWQEVAADALRLGSKARVCVLDEGGYPLPMLATSFEMTDEGFRLVLPKGVPWKVQGKGNLSFAGFQAFLGESEPQADGSVLFRVERAMPQPPSLRDTKEVLQPAEETRRKQMQRVEYEVTRRGQSIPVIPEELPTPTRLHLRRQARVASDKPITGIAAQYGNRST